MPAHSDSDDEAALIRATGSRRAEVFAAVWQKHHADLRRMLELRMDPRLRARIGASDVLQDTWLEAQARIGEYVEQPREKALPLRLWLRFLAAQRLLQARRFHLGARRRSSAVERPMDPFTELDSTVDGAAAGLAANSTTPSDAAARRELQVRLRKAVSQLPAGDREILVRRHIEGLSNAETARELGIEPSAASKRFLRALERLRELLDP